MSAELLIMCTGKGTHAPVELAAVMWTHQGLHSDGVAVWDAKERPRGLVMEIKSDSTRPYKDPSQPARTIRRSPIVSRTRSDGGRTLTLPHCPRCSWPGREVRDTKLREYFETVQDTPQAGTLDVSRVM